MNDYCKYYIETFYEKYIERTFDQNDVALLFVISRDYMKKGSMVREVGDFLAHPKLKDRGIIFDNLEKAVSDFEDVLEVKKRGGSVNQSQITTELLGSNDKLAKELSSIFEIANVCSPEVSENDTEFADFLFCVIFLLSGFKVKSQGAKIELQAVYSRDLRLQIVSESKVFKRHFAEFPILKVFNVWKSCPSLFSAPEHCLENYMARRFKQGFLAAVSYEDDRTHRKVGFDSKNFENGQIWPFLVN